MSTLVSKVNKLAVGSSRTAVVSHQNISHYPSTLLRSWPLIVSLRSVSCTGEGQTNVFFISRSILPSSTEAYLFLSSLQINQFKRLQLKLFSVPTPLKFSSLSSFYCICCYFSSCASSSLYLLSSTVRSFLRNTTFLGSLSPHALQIQSPSSGPAGPSLIHMPTLGPFPGILFLFNKFEHHLPLPCPSLHLFWWLVILLLPSRTAFTSPLHWTHTNYVLMAAINTGKKNPLTDILHTTCFF